MTQTNLCQIKRKNSLTSRKIRLVALNAKYSHSCLALFYIRNELEKHYPQAEVDILQLTINDSSYESLLRITEGDPFAVFFSAAIWNSESVADLVRDVRSCLPECRIVVGGPQASVLREKLPDQVCSMVIGEIEAVDPVFYRDIEAGTLAPKYRGAFLQQKKRKLDYPFRDEDFARHLQNRHIYYETSRGCPYACTYCLSASERGLFHKELAQVKEELTKIIRHNPKVVRFVDRTFNDVPERAYAIWQFLLEQQCDTLFHFEIAPDRFTEEMFTLLEKAEHGRFQFEIGIQSTNDQTLEAIRRRIDKARVHPIIQRLAGLGTIHLHVDLILGLPYETAESFRQSFTDVFAMGAHYIQMGLLKILPDTPICHGAVEYGYVHSTHPPYSVFSSKWLGHGQIRELYWFCECVEKFYNNRYFVSIWKYLRETGEDSFDFFQRLLKEGRRLDFLNRSVTQEVLCGILFEVCSPRADADLLIDLLRFDWLRCGFRRLPDILAHRDGQEDPETTRALLYEELPDSVEGLFSGRTRNQFFKRSVFLRLTPKAGRILGLAARGESVRIAILQERAKDLHEHNMVRRLQQTEDRETD